MQQGFTLLELVITVTVGALVVLALARGLAAAYRGGRSARTTTQATGLARGAIESARALGWTGLAHVPGSTNGDARVSSGTFDPDGSGALPAEDVFESGDALLAPYVETRVAEGITYEIATYVTDAGSALKRVTAVIDWTESGRGRSARLSTLVPATVEHIGAAASVAVGTVLGASVADVDHVEADSSGDTASAASGSFGAGPFVSGTGASSSATVATGPVADAAAAFSTLSVGLPGLTVSATGVEVTASSSAGSMSVDGSGSVTVNGVTYVNPAPGTRVTAGGYRLVLNDQRREADGSMSVTFIRITGSGTEIRIAWAWVLPAEFLDV